MTEINFIINVKKSEIHKKAKKQLKIKKEQSILGSCFAKNVKNKLEQKIEIYPGELGFKNPKNISEESFNKFINFITITISHEVCHSIINDIMVNSPEIKIESLKVFTEGSEFILEKMGL